MTGQDAVETPTDEPRETEAPTLDEDMNLVAKLRAGRRQEKFYLPEGTNPDGSPKLSDTYFIELRSWTGAERDQYLNSGMAYSMRVPARRRQLRHDDVQEMSTAMDRVEQFRMMVRLSVVDFKLAVADDQGGARDVGFQRPPDANWPVFQNLHPDVMDWVRDTIRDFQGIEMEEVGEG